MDEGSQGVLGKSGSAYEHLKRLVVEGLLRPGRRLSPNDLAAEFQISITPIRDALVRLHAEGYVAGEAGRGYFSKPFTVEEQRDLVQVLLIALLTTLDEASGHAASALQEEVTCFRARVPEPVLASQRDPAEAFVQAQEQLLLSVAAHTRSVILPRLMRNAVERTQYIRRLDARRQERRAAVAAALDRLLEAATQRRLTETVEAARAFKSDLVAVLPALVAQANEEIGRNRFP